MRKQIKPGDGDARHGTSNGYANLGCRCVPCTGAWADYYAALRSRVRELAPDDPRHGTETSYHWWHCRCELCRAAHAEKTRGRVSARRQKTG